MRTFCGLYSMPPVFIRVSPFWLFQNLKVACKPGNCSFLNSFSCVAFWNLILNVYRLVFSQRLSNLEFLGVFFRAVLSFQVLSPTNFSCLNHLEHCLVSSPRETAELWVSSAYVAVYKLSAGRKWGSRRAHLFVASLSGITILHCLLPNDWKLSFSIFCPNF